MLSMLFRRSNLAILLALLLVLTGLHYWPHKHPPKPEGGIAGGAPPPGSGDFPAPDGAMRERMNAMLQKLPAEQRQALQERMEKDSTFFASVANLPPEERRQKTQQYFAENPPPPELGPGPNGPGGPRGPGGPGGPGDGGAFSLPPPAARRGMDAGIANSQAH